MGGLIRWATAATAASGLLWGCTAIVAVERPGCSSEDRSIERHADGTTVIKTHRTCGTPQETKP